MVNRISQLDRGGAADSVEVCKLCDCRRCKTRRSLKRARAEAAELLPLLGNLAHVHIPKGIPRSGKSPSVRLWISPQSPPSTLNEDLRTYVITELRLAAIELMAAADRVEQGDAR